MKAIVFNRYGPPDGLELQELPTPQPGDHEVRVRIHAASVNSWDWEFLNGTPLINRLMFGLLQPKPDKRILGADIAGTVDAVGGAVTRLRAGDEVFGDLWDHWGGFAEYVCIAESALQVKPKNATFEQAAAVPQAGVLALQGLRKAGPMQPGQRALINGAGGGVGAFAIQLAKLSGLEITGVDAAHKLDFMRSLGADHVIDYALEDFTKSGKRYDLIIDCQNFRSMFRNWRALKPTGVYAMIGGAVSRVFELWLMSLWGRISRETRKLCLVAEGPNKGLTELKELIEAGKLSPAIDRSYSLAEVPEALRYFGQGRHRGKVVISVAPGPSASQSAAP